MLYFSRIRAKSETATEIAERCFAGRCQTAQGGGDGNAGPAKLGRPGWGGRARAVRTVRRLGCGGEEAGRRGRRPAGISACYRLAFQLTLCWHCWTAGLRRGGVSESQPRARSEFSRSLSKGTIASLSRECRRPRVSSGLLGAFVGLLRACGRLSHAVRPRSVASAADGRPAVFTPRPANFAPQRRAASHQLDSIGRINLIAMARPRR